MTTPTSTPVPSQKPLDLLYNAEALDKVLNSDDPTFLDRFGNERMTVAGVEAYVGEHGILGQALAAQAGAEAAEDGAVAAGEQVGSFTTKALANAALAASQIPLNKGIYVTADANPTANNGFWVNRSGVLVRESTATLPAVAAKLNTVADAQQLKADVAPGKNLFNPNDPGVMVGYAIDGSVSGAGNPFAVAGFRATPFIKVLPSTNYAVSHLRGYAWFDAAQQYISGSATSTGAPASLGLSPSNAVYFRTGISDGNLPTFQFEKGSAPTTWEAYKVTLSSPLAASSVSTAALADASVAPAKTMFLQRGKNMFDKTQALIGYYVDNLGNPPLANAQYEVSEFIPVAAGAQYTYSAAAGTGVRFTAYYNAAGAFISGSAYPGGSASVTETAPAGAASVRVSIYQTSHNAFQMEAGAAATAFEAYRYELRMTNGTPIVPTASADVEVAAARGSRATLNDRMSVALDSYGNLLRYYTGESRMRKTRRKLRQLLSGVATTCVHGVIGDSWTHSPTRWTRKFVTAMQTKYGDGGPGWCGFGWNPVIGLPGGLNGSVSAFVAVAFTGTWTSTYFTSTSPDLCNAGSSTAGDKITVTWSGSGNITSAKFHYITGGAVRYRWNGGAWTALDCSSGTTADLAAIPAGTWTLEIEVVSGAPKPAGIDFRKGNGFVFHKLGASGGAASYVTTVNAALYQASLAALGMDACGVMFGTNDANASVPAATFASQVGTIFDRLRAATPYMDMYAYMPCRNGSADPDLIPGYSLATRATCEQKDSAFIDSQYLFGTTWAEYSALFVDSRHPSDTEGGYVLADGLLRVCECS